MGVMAAFCCEVPREGGRIARQGTCAIGEVIMRVPPVSERVREAPAHALRGVFAGIGQLLLITDKLRNKSHKADDVPPADTPDVTETTAATENAATPAEAAPEQAPETTERDSARTGNVRLLTAEDSKIETTAAAAEPAEAEAEAEVTMEAPVGAAAEAELPLANYDELSVNSLRARLRTLTVAQVAQLAEYEKAHAARPEVVTMFERRIAKLEADG